MREENRNQQVIRDFTRIFKNEHNVDGVDHLFDTKNFAHHFRTPVAHGFECLKHFLEFVRAHLRPQGVVYYNTTGSDDVIATGLKVFPYGLRVYNALALSDSPLVFDRERWKSVLLRYKIDGKPVIDSSRPEQMQKLDFIVDTPEAPPSGKWESIEGNDEMRRRLQNRHHIIITDDNMGVEWQ